MTARPDQGEQAAPILPDSPVSDEAYQALVALCPDVAHGSRSQAPADAEEAERCDDRMQNFVQSVLAECDCEAADSSALRGFTQWYSGHRAIQSLARMRWELVGISAQQWQQQRQRELQGQQQRQQQQQPQPAASVMHGQCVPAATPWWVMCGAERAPFLREFAQLRAQIHGGAQATQQAAQRLGNEIPNEHVASACIRGAVLAFVLLWAVNKLGVWRGRCSSSPRGSWLPWRLQLRTGSPCGDDAGITDDFILECGHAASSESLGAFLATTPRANYVELPDSNFGVEGAAWLTAESEGI